ncbi:MAG: hypothetical protein HY906_18895, partial [Deltaproteobacteria bacterium]|nr:hypothetical protein [Deltaproteobacteria bacterium]
GCRGGAVFENDGDETHPDGRATVRSPGDVDDGLATGAATVTTNHFVKRTDTSAASAGSLRRYEILVAGINQALQAGGLDVPGALGLMADVSAPDISSPTYYTIIVDTSTMTLYLHLAATTDGDAPLQPPHVLPLGQLFAPLPR